MDRGKEYIKMCENAYIFMDDQEPQAGDYWYFSKIKPEESWGCQESGIYLISPYMTDAGYYGPGIGGNDPYDMDGWNPIFPIWRQDQLQKILIPEKYAHPIDELSFISEFAVKSNGMFHSMEQLWLAFVMHEKYNKIWNNENWITEKINAKI